MARSKHESLRRAGVGPVYEQLLLFPERAEYLPQFERYNVRLEHWRDLSSEFRRAFESVYERKSAAILLVHGAQGTGKTLFTRKLVEGFEHTKDPATADTDNLWHVLSGGGESIDVSKVVLTTPRTTLRLVQPSAGWLAEQGKFAADDTHAMRVFVIDDFHKDAFQRELAQLSQGEYLRLKADGKAEVALESIAQQLVEEVRGRFARSLFVLFSNDQSFLTQLLEHLEKSHRGLARLIQLPLPNAPLKEEIVRTNTNRLNPRSYWYCLDRGGPEEKADAFKTLTGDGGFIDSFKAIDRALQGGANRPGRPANKNLLTLVTLGSDPLVVDSFIQDHELRSTEQARGAHVGVWSFREAWASVLGDAATAESARRARLVESEFALRWVALDPRATWCLCHAGLQPELDEFIRRMPRIGKQDATDAEAAMKALDGKLSQVSNLDEIDAFTSTFKAAGQGRSRTYESAIASRFSGREFSTGLAALGSVKPDLTIEQYKACAVTSAKSADVKLIEQALKRDCHVIEFTAHLQADMRGLRDYLREKVETYARLLESV